MTRRIHGMKSFNNTNDDDDAVYTGREGIFTPSFTEVILCWEIYDSWRRKVFSTWKYLWQKYHTRNDINNYSLINYSNMLQKIKPQYSSTLKEFKWKGTGRELNTLKKISEEMDDRYRGSGESGNGNTWCTQDAKRLMSSSFNGKTTRNKCFFKHFFLNVNPVHNPGLNTYKIYGILLLLKLNFSH